MTRFVLFCSPWYLVLLLSAMLRRTSRWQEKLRNNGTKSEKLEPNGSRRFLFVFPDQSGLSQPQLRRQPCGARGAPPSPAEPACSTTATILEAPHNATGRGFAFVRKTFVS